jgi:hypothetical protein
MHFRIFCFWQSYNKSFKPIKDIPDSKLVIDTDYTSDNQKIPLWLFGMITQGKQ